MAACDSDGRTPAQHVTVPPKSDPQHKYATNLQLLLSTPASTKRKAAQGPAAAEAGRDVDSGKQRQQQKTSTDESTVSHEKRLRQVRGRAGDCNPH